MSDCYGVDPQTPANLAEFGVLSSKFRPSEGRFILEYPYDWVQRALVHVHGLSDLDTYRATERLASMRHSLLPTKVPYDDRWTWAENAKRIQADVKLLIGPANSPPTILPFQRTMEEPDLLPESSELLIPRTVAAYIKVAKPLLLTSPKIVMVDPFFSLLREDGRPDRRQQVLKAFLEQAAQGRAKIFRLIVGEKVFSSGDRSEDAFVNAFETIAIEAKAKNLKCEYDTIDGHARYLLGMHSGIQFDWGFDISASDTRLNHVHWLKDKVLNPLLDQYT
jgi:hypothetical protein